MRISSMFAVSVICFILFALCCSCSGSANARKISAPAVKEKNNSTISNVMPGEYIITIAEAEESIIREAFDKYGITSIEHIRKNMYLVRIKNDPGIDAMRSELEHNKSIIGIQPNYKYKVN